MTAVKGFIALGPDGKINNERDLNKVLEVP
jgi:hypothetical protein